MKADSVEEAKMIAREHEKKLRSIEEYVFPGESESRRIPKMGIVTDRSIDIMNKLTEVIGIMRTQESDPQNTITNAIYASGQLITARTTCIWAARAVYLEPHRNAECRQRKRVITDFSVTHKLWSLPLVSSTVGQKANRKILLPLENDLLVMSYGGIILIDILRGQLLEEIKVHSSSILSICKGIPGSSQIFASNEHMQIYQIDLLSFSLVRTVDASFMVTQILPYDQLSYLSTSTDWGKSFALWQTPDLIAQAPSSVIIEGIGGPEEQSDIKMDSILSLYKLDNLHYLSGSFGGYICKWQIDLNTPEIGLISPYRARKLDFLKLDKGFHIQKISSITNNCFIAWCINMSLALFDARKMQIIRNITTYRNKANRINDIFEFN